MSDYEFAQFLSDPTTTVEMVKNTTYLVSGHMMDDLANSDNPHKHEIARFLYETNRFKMGGMDTYMFYKKRGVLI